MRWLFNNQNFEALVDIFENADIALPLDGKMQNLVAGVDTHASRHPSPYDLFSQRTPSKSRPDIARTAESIIADNVNRIAKDGEPIEHNSVVAEPIDLIVALSQRQALIITLPVPQLHTTLREADWWWSKLKAIDPIIARNFLREIKVLESKRGSGTFQGNESRKFFAGHEVLREVVKCSRSKGAFFRAPKTSHKVTLFVLFL